MSKAELWTWYGYDFSNSVFQQSTMGLWFPFFLSMIAKNHACGFTSGPEHMYNATSTPKFFKGYHNTSTICSYDWTQGGSITYNGTIHPPLWMERLNPTYGLNILPVWVRQLEPGRDVEEMSEVSESS